MNKEFMNQIENFCEENDLKVYFDSYSNDAVCVEMEYWSNLGEDVIISVPAGDSLEDFAKNLRSYAEGYDIDEELKLQMGISHSFDGTVEEINATADKIGTALKDLYIKMHNECSHALSDEWLEEFSPVANSIENVSFSYGEDWFELSFADGMPGALTIYEELDSDIDKADIAEKVSNIVNEHYDDFDYNDYTRECFSVSLDDAMNGLPSDIGALIDDKKEIKERLFKLADAADDFAQAQVIEKLNQKLLEAKSLVEKLSVTKQIKDLEKKNEPEKESRNISKDNKDKDER